MPEASKQRLGDFLMQEFSFGRSSGAKAGGPGPHDDKIQCMLTKVFFGPLLTSVNETSTTLAP